MSWINAGFLFGLAALSIPILIHLLRSRKYRLAPMGTIRFLQKAMRQSRRHRRIRQLLLLASRLLILLLLALLFARPFMPQAGEREVNDEQAAVILLDASGSMGAKSLGISNHEIAVMEARRITDSLPPDTSISIAAFAGTVKMVTDDIRCGGSTDFASALYWARDRLNTSEASSKQVFLISDMQRSGLPTEPIDSWPLDLPVELVPLSMPGDWNGLVTSVKPTRKFLRPGAELEIALAYYGNIPEGKAKITVEIEGMVDRLQTTAPIENGTVRIPWSPTKPGIYRGRVLLDCGDAFPLDDVRHFAFPLYRTIPVLLVDGCPGRSPYQDETYYLETALKVAQHEKAVSMFKVERRERLGDPTGFDVVALCNVERLTNRETDLLTGLVEEGMGLIHFLGDRFDETYNHKLCQAGLCPAGISETETVPTNVACEWDTAHPALQLFGNAENSSLSWIRLREAFTMEPEEGSKVLARCSDGEPMLVENHHGKGRVIAFANPCDRDWSDLPQEHIYLPIMRELFCYTAHSDSVFPKITERATKLIDVSPPGIYGQDPIEVVTANTSESDPESCSLDTMREELGIGEAEQIEEPLAKKENIPPRSERKSEIWPYLVLALLGFLLVETLLADGGKT
jgi:Aerotolerance regulator N-terminal